MDLDERIAAGLWGTQEQRAERWTKFRLIRESAVLAAIARMHISGQMSYLTSLLMAIDALSIRCLKWKEEGGDKVWLTDIPTTKQVEFAMRLDLEDSGYDRLERMVASLAAGDERMVSELVAEARLKGTSMITMKVTTADLARMGLAVDKEKT